MIVDAQPEQWDIPRRVWYVLLSWGLAVLMIASLLSFWIWNNQRADAREREQIQTEQDRAMCELTAFFTSSDTVPPAGPEGDRAREGLRRMKAYRATLHCDQIPPVRRD